MVEEGKANTLIELLLPTIHSIALIDIYLKLFMKILCKNSCVFENK